MCMHNNYSIFDVSVDDLNLNKCCYDLNFSTKYKSVVKNDEELYRSHTNNEYLSFNQMAQLIDKYRSQLRKQHQMIGNKSKQLIQ